MIKLREMVERVYENATRPMYLGKPQKRTPIQRAVPLAILFTIGTYCSPGIYAGESDKTNLEKARQLYEVPQEERSN